MLGGIDLLVNRVREWPVASQQQARRNAMLAATDCAARRAEREAVEDFLAERYRPAEPSPAKPHRAARG
jgi:hypothetical protein